MSKEPGVYVGFNVNFTHESLRNYGRLNPDAEYQIRSQYLTALFGTKQAELATKFLGAYRPLPSTAVGSFIGGAVAHAVAKEVVAEYNLVGTGLTLSDPMPMPHCVRYEWINGELCTIYNYLIDVESCDDTCPPPGANYHVVVCVPEGETGA